jgi:RimJ/RimL family protein N-acetyltransferase
LITINKIDWIEESADIGIWLVENATGKGLAFKSLKAIIEVCWNILNLKTLTAHTALSNIKCQCLLEKLSFTKTQLLKNHIKVRGQNVDEYQYQLAKPQ